MSNPQTSDSVIASALAACRRGFVGAGIFSLGVNVLMLTAPLYMLQVFDSVLTSRSTDTLLLLTLVAAIALLTLGALDGVRGVLLARIGGWLDDALGPPVLRAGVEGALATGAPASVQGLRDLSTLRGFLSGNGIIPMMDAPWIPVFIAVIFLLHPMLGWLAIFGGIILFVMAIVNELTTRRQYGDASRGSMATLGHAEAATRNADAIQAMGMLDNLIRHWRSRHGEASRSLAEAVSRGSAIAATSKFLRLVLQVLLMGSGAYLVILNELTPGSMIAASVLMGRALAPIDQSIVGWRSFISARAAYQRLTKSLSIPVGETTTTPLPRPTGSVSAEGVSYIHPGCDEPTVRSVSFAIQPGEALGLIGPTAAGKTTLARLLVGNLHPRAGKVRLDGVNLARWNAEDRGQYVGYLPQDVELFAGTVKDNIARLGEAKPEDVMTAAKIAGVHELILRLPKAYDTEIGPDGAALSGGERQRIALARAIFGKPALLVLDEPNASLDNEGDTALLRAIHFMKQQGTTIIVISHRPHVMRLMDKILVVRDGRNAMFGPRDEVMEKLASAAQEDANNAKATSAETAKVQDGESG